MRGRERGASDGQEGTSRAVRNRLRIGGIRGLGTRGLPLEEAGIVHAFAPTKRAAASEEGQCLDRADSSNPWSESHTRIVAVGARKWT